MSCPDDESLNQLLTGVGADDWRAHVDSCANCLKRLDRISDVAVLDSWRGVIQSDNSNGDNRTDRRNSPDLNRVIAALADETPWPELDTSAQSQIGPWPLLGPALRSGDLGSIGAYPVETELGRGGMGIVFRAVDPALKRTVAIKVLRPATDGTATRARLEREARSLAKLRHTNIVAVHAVAQTPAGLPYLVLEYVDGPSLADHLQKHGPLQSTDAADLIAAVADGVQAAHDVGLIHRDLKPANILLEHPSSGPGKYCPKVVDFGLVRGADTTLSAAGLLAGTPAYISPEQVRDPEQIDARADVYGLGVTLYECLTGEVPFRGSTAMVLRQVLDGEPRPPRQLNENVPRDLETICLKALAKDPAQRYHIMAEFAADLRRFLNNEPILARPTGRVERTWRWCRRNPKLAALTGLVATLLVALAVGGTTAAVLISKAYSRAIVAQQQAEADFDVALHSLQTLAETVQKQMGTQPGLLPVKRKLLETAADGLKKVIHGPTSAERADKTVVIAHTNLGDVYWDLGRTADARQEFESGLRRTKEWLSRQPLEIEARRGAANICNRLGDMANAAKDATAALGYYKQSQENLLSATLLAPNDPKILRDLSVCHNKIGDGELTAGNHAAARTNYEQALVLREKPGTSGDELTRLSDLRFTHNRLTDVCLTMGDLDAAEHHAKIAVENGRDIAKLDANTGRFQTANALDRLGGVLIRRFDPKNAEKCRRESVALRREIVAADTGNANASRQLATAISQHADALFAAGDFQAAIAGHSESIDIYSKLFAADLEAVGLAINLGIAFERVKDVCDRVGQFAEAANWLDQGIELCRRLEHNEKYARLKPEQARQIAETARTAFRFAATHDLAADSTFGNEAPFVQLVLRRIRIMELARRGQTDAVLAVAAELNTSKESIDAMTAARACAIVGQFEPMLKYWRKAVRLEPELANDLANFHEFYAFKDRPEFQELLPKPVQSRGKQ